MLLTPTEELEALLTEVTPGEWSHDNCGETWVMAPGRTENDQDIYLATIVDDDEEGPHRYATEEEQAANARIMALAPELAREVIRLRADLAKALEAIS